MINHPLVQKCPITHSQARRLIELEWWDDAPDKHVAALCLLHPVVLHRGDLLWELVPSVLGTSLDRAEIWDNRERLAREILEVDDLPTPAEQTELVPDQYQSVIEGDTVSGGRLASDRVSYWLYYFPTEGERDSWLPSWLQWLEPASSVALKGWQELAGGNYDLRKIHQFENAVRTVFDENAGRAHGSGGGFDGRRDVSGSVPRAMEEHLVEDLIRLAKRSAHTPDKLQRFDVQRPEE